MGDKHVRDYKIIVPGYPVLILRYWLTSFQWIVYFEKEKNGLSTYDGASRTAEEALEKFIKYRINGEAFIMSVDNGMLAEGKLT